MKIKLLSKNNNNLGLIPAIVLLFSVSLINAATITSAAAGGVWATGSTWVGGVVPAATDDVIIATTGANSVSLGADTTIFNITINSGANLSVTNKILTGNGIFINNGTFTGTTGQLVLSGNFTNSGTFTFTNAGSLYLSGNLSNSGAMSLASAKVLFSGTTNQTIQGFSTTGNVSMLKTAGIATLVGNVNGAGLIINGLGGTLDLGVGLTHTFTAAWTRTNGTVNGGSSILRLRGSVSGSAGIFNAGTGTVEYYASGAQTGAVVTYNKLTLSGTSVKTFVTTPIVNGTLSMEGTANVVVTTGVVSYGVNAKLEYNKAGNYTATSEEWISPFSAAGGVVIANSGTITLNEAKAFNNSIPLTINAFGRLNTSTSNYGLTFNGDFINNGTFTANASPIVITGTMANQNIAGFTTTGPVSMLKTAGTATLNGNTSGGALTINGPGGALSLGTGKIHTAKGNVTITAGTLYGGSSVLNVNSTSTNAWNGTGSNFVAETGTVNFNGAAQTLTTSTIFNNLTFSGTAVKTLTAVPTVNNILSMEGNATVVVSAAPIFGATAKLQYNRTLNTTAGVEWIPTFVASGGVSITNTGVITLNGIKTFNSNVPLTISSGATLSNGGFAISGGSNFTVENLAILNLTGTSSFPTFTATVLGASSTVNYGGAAQTVAVQPYGALTLGGSANKTFAGQITIIDNLAVNGTVVVELPTGTTSTSLTLTFGGVIQTAGSWGGTGSAATNKNATFVSSTTGILNVQYSCLKGTWVGDSNNVWGTATNWCANILPTASTDVIIPVTANNPVISAAAFCRNISINSGANLSISNTNTLKVSGNWINNGTFAANANTVEFNGNLGQSIGGSSVSSFYNLTNSNVSFPLTAFKDIGVNNLLKNTSALSVIDMSTFALTIGSNTGLGQIKTANVSVLPLSSGKTWGNKVSYNSLTGGQTIVGGTYSNSLELNNTSGTQKASGNITVGSRLDIINAGTTIFDTNGFNLTTNILNIPSSNSILDMQGGTLNVATVESMEGTVRFSGATNALAFPTGTVDYYGSGQTVKQGSYSKLLFSGSGGSYNIENNLVYVNNKLNVTAGALTVKNPFFITVEGQVTVIAPGTLTLENNASLVQTSYTGTNSGNIIVKRNTSPIVLDDYTYWSSPTSGSQTLLNFSPNTQGDKYFDFDNNWANVNASTTVFVPGVGYNIRAPEGISASVATAYPFQFTGVPNNGTINVPVTEYLEDGYPAGLRLVGNPYPSALDAEAFIDANVATGVITGTLYFWTHNHRLNGNDYVATDYATYSSLGGSGVGIGSGNLEDPTRYIPAGQGFFIENDISGNVTFNNTMRVGGNNGNFYKVRSKKEAERHRIWFSLSNGTSNTSQALVGYATDATNGYDPGYDSYVYDDAQAFSFYSLINENKMTIQARALPFVETDTVPLGYAINVAGNATLTVYKYDGLFSDGQDFYLEDLLLGVIHNIKETPYNFMSEAGSFNDRFVLRYTDKTLGTTDFESTLENQVLVSNKNKQISITSFAGAIDKITIFDTTARKIYEKTNVDSQELKISHLVSSKQVLFVKVVLQDGKSITKKIIH